MNDTAGQNPKPPFRGFTEIFKHVNKKKVEDPQSSAEEVHQSEYKPRRLSSQYFENNQPIVKQIIPNEEPPPNAVPPPVTYEKWFTDRISAAVARCQEMYGPINDENEFKTIIDEDVRRLVYKIKCFSSGNLPKNHDQCYQIGVKNREKIYKRCNINKYPQKFEFDLLNKRLRRLMTSKSDSNWLNEFIQKSVLSDDVWADRDYGETYDIYAAEREELSRLINERLHCSPNKLVNFRPENLFDWRARVSFNIDKKYKYFPKVTVSAEENFHDWLDRTSDLLDRTRNREATRKLSKRTEMSKVAPVGSDMEKMSLRESRPSLSRCSSEFYYNAKKTMAILKEKIIIIVKENLSAFSKCSSFKKHVSQHSSLNIKFHLNNI